ncbi:alpha/beta hydrolase [Xylophilus sp. GW821-FHT01B05]
MPAPTPSPDLAAFYDREFNTRLGLADPAALLAGWQERARKARASLQGHLDLAYGPGPRERLDLFPGKPGSALLVFIHGGFWRARDKEEFTWVAEPYVQRGVSVALLEYALAPQVTLSTIVEQTQAAIAWLHRHAASYGVRADPMVIAGHSAGGQLAALVACQPQHGVPPPRAVVPLCALSDLQTVQWAPSHNQDLQLTDDEVLHLSPARLQPVAGVQVVTAVGSAESREFLRQNALFAQHWGSARVRDIALPGANHFSACEALADVGHPLFEAVLGLCTLG